MMPCVFLYASSCGQTNKVMGFKRDKDQYHISVPLGFLIAVTLMVVHQVTYLL